MKGFIISLSIFMTITMPISLYTAFKVYLKNGRIITDVERVEKGERIKIYKSGILLELPSADVIKTEEYEAIEVEEKTIEETQRTEEQPEYLRYEEGTGADKENLQRLKNRYEQVIEEIKRIEELERRSSELQREIRRKAYSPREAKMLRQEKEVVDRELENMRTQKESLLQEKEELEYQIRVLKFYD